MGTEYKVVIFDMDGTFLDSRGGGTVAHEWAYEAFRKTLSNYGLNLSIAEIDKYFLTPLYSDGAQGVKTFCDRFELDWAEVWESRGERRYRSEDRRDEARRNKAL